MSRDLVVFGEDWGAHPSSTQHLIRRLARDYRVLWVNSIGLRRPRLSVRDLRRVAEKLRNMLKPMSAEALPASPAGLQIVQPRVLSWPGNPLARQLNRRLLGRQLRQAMASMGMHNPLVWSSLPSAVDVLDLLDPAAVIYYCGDDFSALAGVDHTAVQRQEQQLVDRADLVLAASAALQARFPAAKTRLLAHGVDARPFASDYLRPADLPYGKPIMGFYGSLSNWLDTDLLLEVARALPHWNLVLIGPLQCDLRTLLTLPNVHWLGPRSHSQLPAYVQHWQVSLLPFLDNAQIRACNPLKLREYLATGKPLVSTDFPALDGYRQHVQIARGAEDFVQAICQAALDAPTQELQWLEQLHSWSEVAQLSQPHQARQMSIAGDSWESRAETLQRWLAAL